MILTAPSRSDLGRQNPRENALNPGSPPLPELPQGATEVWPSQAGPHRPPEESRLPLTTQTVFFPRKTWKRHQLHRPFSTARCPSCRLPYCLLRESMLIRESRIHNCWHQDPQSSPSNGRTPFSHPVENGRNFALGGFERP